MEARWRLSVPRGKMPALASGNPETSTGTPRPARDAPARPPERMAAFEDAPFGLATFGEDLRCTVANPAFGAMVGRTPASCLGLLATELLPRSASRVEGALTEVLQSGMPRYRIDVELGGAGSLAQRGGLTVFRFGGTEGEPHGVMVLLRALGLLEAEEGEGSGEARRRDVAAERLGRLQDVSAELSAAVTEEEVSRAVLQVGLQVLGASGGTLSFPVAGELRTTHAAGPLAVEGGDAAPALLAAVTADAFEKLQPIWIGSATELLQRYPRLAPARGAIADASWAAAPLVVRGRALGVLGIGFAGAHAFDDESRAFIEALARQAALAVDRYQLFEAQRTLRADAERATQEREALVRQLRRTLWERDESMALLDGLFDNAPVGLALLDRHMRFVRANAHLARMNDLPVAAYPGRALWDGLPPVSRDELSRDFQRVLLERVPVEERPVATTQAGGLQRFYMVSWFPVAAGEWLIGVGLLVRDVTEQRRAEQSQRNLLGVVGHDLRSPLMAITASAELMQSSPLDDRSARSVGRILRAAHRIDGIIRALVDYTLVQVGSGIPLHRRSVDLAQLAHAVSEEAEAAHPGRSVLLVAPAPVRGDLDPDRLGQALANLVGNALQYGQEESPVRVACRQEGGDGVVEVTNDGPPIPPDLIPQLFEPFRRGTDERSQRRKGLGLGLFIAHQIASAHGGRIDVRSDAAIGTTFAVHIPLTPPPPRAAVSRDRDRAP